MEEYAIQGMDVPVRPVRLDREHKQAIIELADRPMWEKAGWFMAGSTTENNRGDNCLKCWEHV